jgi:hypothetical protein
MKFKKSDDIFYFSVNDFKNSETLEKIYLIQKNFLYPQINNSNNRTILKLIIILNKILDNTRNPPRNPKISLQDISLFFPFRSSDFNLISKSLELNIDLSKKETTYPSIIRYIYNFKNDKLISDQEVDYYSFKKNISYFCEEFNQKYDNFGKRFSVSEEDITFRKETRLYELVLYLLKEKYLKINSCKYRIKKATKGSKIKSDCLSFSINLTFNKSPLAISNIENAWIVIFH